MAELMAEDSDLRAAAGAEGGDLRENREAIDANLEAAPGNRIAGDEGSCSAPVGQSRGDRPQVLTGDDVLAAQARVDHPQHVDEAIAVPIEVRPVDLRVALPQGLERGASAVHGCRAAQPPRVVGVVSLALIEANRRHDLADHLQSIA
jgi:hypothetical protein